MLHFCRLCKYNRANGECFYYMALYSKLTICVWHRIVEHKILCSETTPGRCISFRMVKDFTQGIFHKDCKPLHSITSSHYLTATRILDSNIETSGMEKKENTINCQSCNFYRSLMFQAPQRKLLAINLFLIRKGAKLVIGLVNLASQVLAPEACNHTQSFLSSKIIFDSLQFLFSS